VPWILWIELLTLCTTSIKAFVRSGLRAMQSSIVEGCPGSPSSPGIPIALYVQITQIWCKSQSRARRRGSLTTISGH